MHVLPVDIPSPSYFTDGKETSRTKGGTVIKIIQSRHGSTSLSFDQSSKHQFLERAEHAYMEILRKKSQNFSKTKAGVRVSPEEFHRIA